MPVEIRVPSLGESIVDAVIASWLKHEGDNVSQGDALVELETDKVNVEVTAEQNGWVLSMKVLRQGMDKKLLRSDNSRLFRQQVRTSLPPASNLHCH